MAREPRRALIMAGGGMKVAFQAGVLQVLLDEATLDGEPLDFTMADAASGGVFNLAMWCQGMSGTRIADNWRAYRPWRATAPNWWHLPRLLYAGSLFTLERMRRSVLPAWGLDWDRIRATPRLATFNVFNFSKQRLESVTADRMTEDHLMAAVALPMWFPPVTIDGDRYIDAVFATDANLEEAIRRGADELWVIWTVSRRGEWHNGFVAQYFQIIEASANSELDSIRRRVDANNAAIATGGCGEFGRPITVRLLQAEVPLHYLVNLNRDRFTLAVNAGVEFAREWCRREGLGVDGVAAPVPTPAASTLSFTEEMKGRLDGSEGGSPALLHLTIDVADVDRFVTHPDHLATATGYLDCAMLGGRLTVERGTFNLLVDAGDPTTKRMLYDLELCDRRGRQLTLRAVKEIVDDPGLDLWRDTTRATVTVHSGWSGTGGSEPVATGVVRIHLVDFLRQLTTFRVGAPTMRAKAEAMTRFGRLFLGKLWDVYAREVLTQSPL